MAIQVRNERLRLVSGLNAALSADRQRGCHRPPRRPLHPPVQHGGPGDLIDRPATPAQLIQPLLCHAQPGVIRWVPGRLHPPVAAHHRPA